MSGTNLPSRAQTRSPSNQPISGPPETFSTVSAGQEVWAHGRADKSAASAKPSDNPLSERGWSTLRLPVVKPRPIDELDALGLVLHLRVVARDHGGKFVVCNVGSEEPCTPCHVRDEKTGELVWARAKRRSDIWHVRNDENAVENLWTAIEAINAEPGNNAYICVSLMKQTLAPGKKGTESDTLGILAAVTDWDGKNDPETRTARLPLPVHFEVETSPANYQCWYFFDRPYPVAEAKPVLAALARSTRSDSTFNADRVMRMPGTWNWPSLKKIIDYGRDPEPFHTRVSFNDDGRGTPTITLDELRAAILAKYPDAFDQSSSGTSKAATENEFDWTQRRGNLRPITAEEKIDRRLDAKPGEDRSPIAFGAICYLRRFGYSAGEIYTELAKRAVLPSMGHYIDNPVGFEKALRADIKRAFTKPEAPKHELAEVYRAVGVAPAFTRADFTVAGEYLPAGIEQARRGLIAAEVDYFEYGGRIVRPGGGKFETRAGDREGLVLHPVGAAEMRVELTKVVAWHRWNAETSKTAPTNCPADVAQAYLESRGRWGLRKLRGIITAPTLRPDGSLLTAPGYDPATELLYLPSIGFPEITDQPTNDQAIAALTKLKNLISTFPLDDVSRSIALCAFLTGAIRRVLGKAPLFAFNAPASRSGKGLLIDTIAIVVSGAEASIMVQAPSDEELEKRLVSKLRAGHPCLHIDECQRPLGGAALHSLLTAPGVREPRILGESNDARVPSNLLIMASGNRLTIAGDMVGRTLRATIDPECEHPGARSFTNNPVVDARASRGELLAAALTILRAYDCAGRPAQDMRPLGGFEEWSSFPRAALVWLGEADPVNQEEIEADDPEREMQRMIVLNWHKVYKTEAMLVSEVAEAAKMEWSQEQREAHGLLLATLRDNSAPPKAGQPYNLKSIGKLLNAKVVGGVFSHETGPMRLVKAPGRRDNLSRYAIRTV